MIEPFAPLYPWLVRAIRDEHVAMRIPLNAPPDHPALSSCGVFLRDSTTAVGFPVAGADLDLRHGPTRYAVLRALADAGHVRPWALGAPWSPLTDEQAGRATAAILRAVGEDPSKPVGVVPVCVLEAWREPDHADQSATRYVLAGDRPGENLGYVVPACEVGPRLCIARHTYRSGWRVWPRGRSYLEPDAPPEKASGLEIGDAGRLAADNAARSMGCLMIEDLTP